MVEKKERSYQKDMNGKIAANYPLILIVSYEWRRVEGMAIKASVESKRDVYRWNNVDGCRKWDRDERRWLVENKDIKSPTEALEWFIKEAESGNRIIFIMEDLHTYYDSPQKREIITLLKKIPRINGERTLILSQHNYNIPPELEKEVYVMDIPLPDIGVLKSVIREVKLNLEFSDEQIPPDDWDYIAEAALGLTEMEAKYTFLEIAALKNRLTRDDIPKIVEKKEQIIKKSGILEYFHPREAFKDVGGLNILKEWLKVRKKGFDPRAKDFGILPPKGVLLLGIQGCGKSLIAKAISSEWNLPLLKLDIGRVFGGIVGESENNIRRALSIAEAISPSILWIDEIEKGLSGVESSGATDSGTTARVFGTILTWMQEKEKPVFVVATANNIENLPPELLRKGRFDEIFFVDLPGKESREEIWKIHLRKRLGKRYHELIKSGEININKLVENTKGYSGAEIEEALNEALYSAYYKDRELSMDDLQNAIRSTYPLSKIMGEVIINLRKWAEVRARRATHEEVEEIDVSEAREVPRLKGEIGNPFIEE